MKSRKSKPTNPGGVWSDDGDDGEACGRRRSMNGILDDEILALILAALPAPDRLRCESVCKRWRNVATRSDFTTELILPEDPLDDTMVLESAQGWSGMREDARDDTLAAAAAKAGGRLRSLDVSGCAELSHKGVIEVLRANPELTHLIMDEGEGDNYRLRLRVHHLIALAHTLGGRGGDGDCGRAGPSAISSCPSPRLDVSVEIAGNKELEVLREVLVASGDTQATFDVPPLASGTPAHLRVGGAEVRVVALTVSLVFVDDTSELLLGDEDGQELALDAGAAGGPFHETNTRTSEHLVDVLRILGARGIRRLNFGERALSCPRGAAAVLAAVGEACSCLRELRVEGPEVLQKDEVLRCFSLAMSACQSTLRRLTVYRAQRSRLASSFELPNACEQVHFEMPAHEEFFPKFISWAVSARALSLARRPSGGERTSRSASAASLSEPTFTLELAKLTADALTDARVCRVTHLDLSNLRLETCEPLTVILNSLASRPGPCELKVLAMSGNDCRLEWTEPSFIAFKADIERFQDALTRALNAHAATLTHLDIGGLPRSAMVAAVRCLPALSSLQVLDLSGSRRWNVKTSNRGGNSGASSSESDSLSRTLAASLADSACRLKRLILVDCDITTHDLSNLRHGVLACDTLVAVDLSYSSGVGDAGCKELARWIDGNKALARLELECCSIGDAGAKCLARAVAANKWFRRLDLALNPSIGRSGRAALATSANGRPGIWHKKTTEDTPWAGSTSDDDDEDQGEDDDESEDYSYLSDDDGYFASHYLGSPRQSAWSL